MAGEDRISLLPDELLLEIISKIKIMDKETAEERFMSTREVIKTTTTISKRWKHLWTGLPNLVFLHDDLRGKDNDNSKYFSFISKTLSECPTGFDLHKFKLQVKAVYEPMEVHLNSWIRHAITRDVQEIDSTLTPRACEYTSYDDDLFFNNSCLVRLELSSCVFNPPPAIRWVQLKFLRIHRGILDNLLIEKMLSGTPCLKTFELNNCDLPPLVPKALFQKSGLVLERLSCGFKTYQSFRNHDDLLFDNIHTPSSVRMTFALPHPPPRNGAIPFLQLKFLHIYCGVSYDDQGVLDEVSIREILSGNPFLETFELNDFSLTGNIPKTLFGNFGALEHLACGLKTYQRISSKDEFLDNAYFKSMKLSRPPNGAISSDKLKFLRIDFGKLDEDSFENMLSGSPFLETLHLSRCYGCRQINVTSKSLKNLVISGYGCEDPKADYYIDTVVINAPHILRLTIEDTMNLEKLLLENVSSLATAYLGFEVSEDQDPRDQLEENLLHGLLSSLGHVNEIVLDTQFPYRCFLALTRLEAKGFQFRKRSFRRGVLGDSCQVYSLNQK